MSVDHVRNQNQTVIPAHRIKRWLLVAIALGFFGLGADTFFEHFITMRHQAQWIPIIFGPIAGVTALATAWRPHGLLWRLFFTTSWLAVLVGLAGIYYHGASALAQLGDAPGSNGWEALLLQLRVAPPVGAPLAFTGLGVLGLLLQACSRKLERILVQDEGGAAPASPGPLAYALFVLAFAVLVVAPLLPMLAHRLN